MNTCITCIWTYCWESIRMWNLINCWSASLTKIGLSNDKVYVMMKTCIFRVDNGCF